MAVQEQANVKVTLNNEEAKRELEELNSRIEQLIALKKKAEEEGDVQGFRKIDTELKKAKREAKRYQQQLYDVDKALKNINGASWNELKKAESALVAQTKSLNRQTDLYTQKKAQLSRIRTELQSINAKQKASSGLWAKMADNFNRYFGMATAWIASIAGITLKARNAINGFFDREDMLGKVQSLTKLSGEQLEYLEKKAVEFSTTTTDEGIKIQKSADEILEAFQLVGSAQPALLKDKEALAAVTREILIQSEAAEGMSLTEAIDATTKAMNQYGAAASQTARYTNAMAAGAQKGAVQIPEVGESIKEFGTNAKAANVPIEQSVSLIELVGEKAGVVGNRAGIQLRNFFTILSGGADETNPEIVGLNNALDKLSEKNLSSAQYVALFGRENSNVARIIVQNRQYLDQLTDALTGTDTAYEQAIDNTKDQKAALAQAKNRAHEYANELGEELAPIMAGIVSKGGLIIKFLTTSVKLFIATKGVIIPLTTAIITYTTAVKLNSIWQDRNNTQSKTFILLSKLKTKWAKLEKAALLLLTAAQAALTGNIKRATVAMRLFNMTTKLSPIGLIVTLLTTAASAYLLFRDNTKKATSQQKKFNDVLEKGNELISQTKTLKERVAIVKNLSKNQLNNLKSDLDEQLKLEDSYNKLLLQKAKARWDQDEKLQQLHANLNEKNITKQQKVNILSEIEQRKQYLIMDLEQENKGNQKRIAQLKDYQKTVNAELKKRPKDSGDDNTNPDNTTALAALEKAHNTEIVAIKKYYADKEQLQKEAQARLLASQLAYLKAKENLEADDNKRLQLQSTIIDTHQKYNATLKQAIPEIIKNDKASRSLNTRLLEQKKLLTNARKAQEEAVNQQQKATEKQQQQAQTIQTIGSSVTDFVSGALDGSMDDFSNFGQQLILMSLQILKSMVPIWSAQILGYSLASADSVATMGISGVAKYTAIMALLDVAISAAEGAVKSTMSSDSSSGSSSQYAEGKYPILGSDDGRLYQANYAGKPVTGIYSGPQIGLFNEDPNQPELVVDGKTTRQLMVNYPAVYKGIRQLAGGGTPQFKQGKYPAENLGSKAVSIDPELKKLMQSMHIVLSDLQKNGVAGYFDLFGKRGLNKANQKIDEFNNRVTRS